MAKVEIFTDGSCHNASHNKGGYGIVMIVDSHVGKFAKDVAVRNDAMRQWCGGSYMNTTSARMEVLAIVKAMEKCTPGDEITIYSDNQYAVHTLSKNWIFKWRNENWRGRKNCDLWKRFLDEYIRLQSKVTLEWVRGHVGNQFNELADQLATMGAGRKETMKDIRYN